MHDADAHLFFRASSRAMHAGPIENPDRRPCWSANRVSASRSDWLQSQFRARFVELSFLSLGPRSQRAQNFPSVWSSGSIKRQQQKAAIAIRSVISRLCRVCPTARTRNHKSARLNKRVRRLTNGHRTHGHRREEGVLCDPLETVSTRKGKDKPIRMRRAALSRHDASGLTRRTGTIHHSELLCCSRSLFFSSLPSSSPFPPPPPPLLPGDTDTIAETGSSCRVLSESCAFSYVVE